MGRVHPVDNAKSKVSTVTADAADETRIAPSANAPIMKEFLNKMNPLTRRRWASLRSVSRVLKSSLKFTGPYPALGRLYTRRGGGRGGIERLKMTVDLGL
jgi:hypothetical protein